MLTQWLIERKRDGAELDATEIDALICGYTAGEIPDCQMAAFAMAVFFRGMTPAETAALTNAMMHSGDILTFDDEPRPTADKHSTGGIGDKISLILAPLAAAAGMAVPMISGRGLGLTGGTLDKLESIPGFRVHLGVADFKRIVRAVGCCMIGQTETLAPADRKFYALRDVTGTVPSIPLITASIMSKKLAEGAQTLVFDVKCGRGAFMRTRENARELAASLIRTGAALNRRMAALITDMNRPLGAAIGNALEVREAVEVLRGGGPDAVRQLTIELTAQMAVLSGRQPTLARARPWLAKLLDEGRALERFARMVTAQGGDARFLDDATRLPAAPVQLEARAPRAGYVADIDAEALGRVVLALGAGRRLATDAVDPATGISHLTETGRRVDAGEPLCHIHARDETEAAAAAAKVAAAIVLAAQPPGSTPLILETISEAP
jgi:pyrimidine-nucleoside phosphorylase